LIKGLRRLGVVTALIGTALAGSLAAGSPAQASGCHTQFGIGFSNGVLRASHWKSCFDPESGPFPLSVKIERWDKPLSGAGYWTAVAQGSGNISYTCQSRGSSLFRFTAGNQAPTGTYACY
jgi:hypothetical protein